jgi:hypothetical protein
VRAQDWVALGMALLIVAVAGALVVATALGVRP